MAKLTKMQQKIYDYIAETTRQQGYVFVTGEELLTLKGITPEAGVTYRCAP